jgi:hypothetical protein
MVRVVPKFELVKKEDHIFFYKYKVILEDGLIIEGDDFKTSIADRNKALDALIEYINNCFAEIP